MIHFYLKKLPFLLTYLKVTTLRMLKLDSHCGDGSRPAQSANVNWYAVLMVADPLHFQLREILLAEYVLSLSQFPNSLWWRESLLREVHTATVL